MSEGPTTGEPTTGGRMAGEPAAGEPMTGELLYAYAVARDAEDADAALEAVGGVCGGPVRTVRHLGLAALVSPVPAADFDEAGLRKRLEDLPWLSEVARAHQRVVDAASRERCVLPLRLATVYRDEAGLRRVLAAEREEFGSVLDRLEGRVEWGVKAYATAAPGAEGEGGRPAADAASEGSQGSGSSGGSAGSARSGRDYLRRRGAQRRAREERWQRADERARLVHETLAALAEGVRLHPPQDARLSGDPDRNVLNAAYLVRRERSSAFTSRVGELAQAADGVRLELTGPWAPYSFVSRETSHEAPGEVSHEAPGGLSGEASREERGGGAGE
ncbi:GvpL/GvpF family gas vesicle protein [Streptomyces sp. NPDC050617]|uniref:GvpL/GvpF family gas vesicle protein n=1 Tax=Streptomyces sp. NPDC050617 TaxID=3154628 RepID=UPI003433BAAC